MKLPSDIPDDAIPMLSGMPVAGWKREQILNSAKVASYTPTPGSIIVACGYCNEPMILGPRQQAVRADAPRCRIICFYCVAEIMKAAKNAGIDTNTEIRPLGPGGHDVEFE
jgi:hypothetical protein